MDEQTSLDLDVETVGQGDREQRVLRIAVVGTWGVTRDGRSSVVTEDCPSAGALAREVGRLHGELDAALARAEQVCGETPDPETVSAEGQESEAALLQAAAGTVAEVMTRQVRSVAPEESLAAAKAAMDEGGFRHLVVLEETGEIAGILSQRDIAHGPLAWSLGQGLQAHQTLLESTRVKDAMHTGVETIESGASLRTAARRLVEAGIGCLPVVEAERLVGILTESDFARLAAGLGSGARGD